MAELEAKMAKAARDYDKLCSGIYDKRSAILKSSDAEGSGIPDFWLGVLQVTLNYRPAQVVSGFLELFIGFFV